MKKLIFCSSYAVVHPQPQKAFLIDQETVDFCLFICRLFSVIFQKCVEWTGLILVISHTYECNTDISLLIFIDKSWLMQNMGTIDWSLPLPMPLVLTLGIYRPAAIVRGALILQNTRSLLCVGHEQYQLACGFYLECREAFYMCYVWRNFKQMGACGVFCLFFLGFLLLVFCVFLVGFLGVLGIFLVHFQSIFSVFNFSWTSKGL